MAFFGNFQGEIYGCSPQVLGIDYAIQVGNAEDYFVCNLFDRYIVDVFNDRFGLCGSHEERREGCLLLVELLHDELERFAVGGEFIDFAGH